MNPGHAAALAGALLIAAIAADKLDLLPHSGRGHCAGSWSECQMWHPTNIKTTKQWVQHDDEWRELQ